MRVCTYPRKTDGFVCVAHPIPPSHPIGCFLFVHEVLVLYRTFTALLSCRTPRMTMMYAYTQAIEEAAAMARAQSAERIAALQAQILELQAGG